MKKKGFTLIEIVAVLAILSVLLLINLKGFKYYESHMKKIENISILNDLKDVLSFSKRYCYENEKVGEIYFDNCDELTKVYLLSEGSIKKSIHLNEKLKLASSNYVSNNKRFLLLKVNKYGYISPYTVNVIDESGNSKKIIIQVGGNLIYIKNE